MYHNSLLNSYGRYVTAEGLNNQTYLFYNEIPTAPSGGDGDDEKGGEAIPGYELLFLIGFICVTSAILVRKLKK